MGLNNEAIERASRAVASSVRPYSSSAMNCPRRSLSCPTRKRLNPDAVLEQPQERAAVHHRDPGIAQRHHVVAPGLVLQHGALAEPSAGGETCKARGLAAAGNDAHPRQAGDNAGPVVELVTAHEDEFIGAIGFLDDAGARDLDLAFVEFARPGRDAFQVIRSNHCFIDRRLRPLLSYCTATMIPRPHAA